MNTESPPSRNLKTRYKAFYVLSVLALAALLCVNFGVIYTLALTPPEDPAKLMRLVYLCMVAGFFLLATQALLILKNVIATLDRDAATADEVCGQLEQLTVIDTLTKAYNRGKFEEVTARELGNVRRYAHDLSGIIFDVDDFKAINETHGYCTGDRLLANLAHFIDSKLRNNDYMFRWRGGKFIILAPHTELDQAALVAEKLRELVAHKIFGGKIKMTISLGVIQATGDDTTDTLMHRLQTALAGAKNSGKNQVVVD
jgi:diguanylate cyclase (GGDEF)-like protein